MSLAQMVQDELNTEAYSPQMCAMVMFALAHSTKTQVKAFVRSALNGSLITRIKVGKKSDS